MTKAAFATTATAVAHAATAGSPQAGAQMAVAQTSEPTTLPTGQWLAFLGGFGISPKLSVSTPGDADEREADAVADQVMRMAAPSGEPVAVSSFANSALARACCANCKPDDEDTRIARKARVPGVAQIAARQAASAVSTGGQPLGAGERTFFEPRFGRDLSAVRIHTGHGAHRAASGIGALAYTHRQHIAFANGQYQPGTDSGRRLLAHELTHTLQQSSSPPLLAASAAPEKTVRVARTADAGTIFRSCPPPVVNRGGAAGCGLCMGPNFGAIGAVVHTQAQYRFFSHEPSLIQDSAEMEFIVPTAPDGEPTWFNPEIDLTRVIHESGLRVIEIGEIKPFDDAGRQAAVGLSQLEDYRRELDASGLFDVIRLLTIDPPPSFPFLEPTRPPACPIQTLNICRTQPGIYQYYCDPSWATAQRNPACHCGRRERRRERERERVRVRDPINVPITPPVDIPVGLPEGRRPPVDVPVPPPVGIPVPPPIGVPVPPPVEVPVPPIDVPVPPPIGVPAPPVTAPNGPVSTPEGDGVEVEPPDNVRPFPVRPRPPVPIFDEDDLAAAARVALLATVLAALALGAKQLLKGAGRRVIAPLEAMAVLALVVFYSDRVEAHVGPGESPLEAIFEAMAQDGVPVDPAMRARIEADPALREALENAARTGDLSEAERAISQRTMEIIAANPEEFSDEDLRILAEGMDAASQSSSTTQPTVESLRRAIEARRRGEPIGPIIDDAVREGAANAPNSSPAAADADTGPAGPGATETPATPPAAEPTPPAEEPLRIAEEYRTQLSATPARERLFRSMAGRDGGPRITDAVVERFLAIVPGDLTDAQAEAIIEHLTGVTDETEDQIFAALERAVTEARAGSTPPDGIPTTDPAAPQPAAPTATVPVETAPEVPAAPREPETSPAPTTAPAAAEAEPAPRAGLTPERLARLQRFLARNPVPGLVNPLPEAEDRHTGFRFTRLVAMRNGNSRLAGYMTMEITTVRGPNDFDVVMSPTVFYNARGQRQLVWPPTPTSTSITA